MAEITFDPAIISFSDLLHVFFTLHDPTTLNRQGNDVGEQYRSVIFYRDEAQKKTAEEVIAELTRDKVFADPIVTAVEPASTFYVAEDYHQNYFANNRQSALLRLRGRAQGEENPRKIRAAAETLRPFHHGSTEITEKNY